MAAKKFGLVPRPPRLPVVRKAIRRSAADQALLDEAKAEFDRYEAMIKGRRREWRITKRDPRDL